jgi:hypothetical protein
VKTKRKGKRKKEKGKRKREKGKGKKEKGKRTSHDTLHCYSPFLF